MRQETEEQLWITKIPIPCWILADVLVFILDSMVEGGTVYFFGLRTVTSLALHIIGAVMAFVVLGNIAERVNWRQNKVFSALTRYSMPMYLFHQQIIYFVIVWLNGKVNPYINASVNFAAAVVGSFIISWILMRFKVTRFLIGEKSKRYLGLYVKISPEK